jgi:hypothetical protein
MFVAGKLFQPNLMFVGKARNVPQSGAHEQCFTWVGMALPANIRLG